MGFFSWKTSDTQKSISNVYSCRGALPVYLITPDNEKIFEPEYEGYGVFGGHDAYALLAKWNCPEKCTGNEEKDRNIGIDLQFGTAKGNSIKFPLKFAETKNAKYENLPAAENDPEQGYFYPEDEEYDDDDY